MGWVSSTSCNHQVGAFSCDIWIVAIQWLTFQLSKDHKISFCDHRVIPFSGGYFTFRACVGDLCQGSNTFGKQYWMAYSIIPCIAPAHILVHIQTFVPILWYLLNSSPDVRSINSTFVSGSFLFSFFWEINLGLMSAMLFLITEGGFSFMSCRYLQHI